MKTVDAGGVVTPKVEYQIKCMEEIADEYRTQWDGKIPSLEIDEKFMV